MQGRVLAHFPKIQELKNFHDEIFAKISQKFRRDFEKISQKIWQNFSQKFPKILQNLPKTFLH